MPIRKTPKRMSGLWRSRALAPKVRSGSKPLVFDRLAIFISILSLIVSGAVFFTNAQRISIESTRLAIERLEKLTIDVPSSALACIKFVTRLDFADYQILEAMKGPTGVVTIYNLDTRSKRPLSALLNSCVGTEDFKKTDQILYINYGKKYNIFRKIFKALNSFEITAAAFCAEVLNKELIIEQISGYLTRFNQDFRTIIQYEIDISKTPKRDGFNPFPRLLALLNEIQAPDDFRCSDEPLWRFVKSFLE